MVPYELKYTLKARKLLGPLNVTFIDSIIPYVRLINFYLAVGLNKDWDECVLQNSRAKTLLRPAKQHFICARQNDNTKMPAVSPKQASC